MRSFQEVPLLPIGMQQGARHLHPRREHDSNDDDVPETASWRCNLVSPLFIYLYQEKKRKASPLQNPKTNTSKNKKDSALSFPQPLLRCIQRKNPRLRATIPYTTPLGDPVSDPRLPTLGTRSTRLHRREQTSRHQQHGRADSGSTGSDSCCS